MKVRGGTSRLRIEQGRYKSKKGCVYATKEEIEDEKHFILVCDLYEEERKQLWTQLRITGESKASLNDEQLNALIGVSPMKKKKETQ